MQYNNAKAQKDNVMSKFTWGWGHSFKNYLLMFDLQDNEMQEPILDIASGASCFNAEMYRQGYHATSADPLYETPQEDIEAAVDKMLNHLEKRIEQRKDKFNWANQGAVSDLMHNQRAMAEIFLKDYAKGVFEKRYLPDALPNLSFRNYQFSLVLCANFLFDGPYANDIDFQIASIKEMCRVGREARIFPLLNDEGDLSDNIAPITALLQSENYGVEIREVAYHLQKSGNAMLRVWPNECQL